jgi:hypothetical protein
VEAQLGDDVRRVGRLALERLFDQLRTDVTVALGVAPDPHVGERVPGRLQFLQQGQGVGERPGRLGGVTGDDEHAVDLGRTEARDHVGELRPVPDQSGGQVWRHAVPVAGQALGQFQGRGQALRLGAGHGQGDVEGDVGDDGLLGAPERQHLVAGVLQRSGQGPAEPPAAAHPDPEAEGRQHPARDSGTGA